jgi:mannan endo-1,4-beta-mannosidase
VQELIRQHRKGSIIAICWHAVRPTEDEPVTFRSSVQGKLTRVQFEELVTPGSPLNRRWLAQVDVVAEYLKQLQAARVPILWRPFHEINGDWFWWNGWRGPRGSAQLYRMLFDRLVNHHKIDNLIWVWNPDRPEREDKQFVDYFPGHEYVDVLSLDTYGGYNQSYYDDLNALSGGKPMGISECGANLPAAGLVCDPAQMGLLHGLAPNGTGRRAHGRGPGDAPRGDAIDYREMARHPRLLSLEDAAYQEAIAPLRALSGGGRAE